MYVSILLAAAVPGRAQEASPRSILQPSSGASPAMNPALRSRAWPAFWISHPTADRQAYGVYHFRRTFSLEEVPSSFVIHVSGDNRYRLFVNGMPVSLGPARGTVENWHFETVDIARHLRPGRNALAAVVWNYAEHRPVAQVSFETAFLVQGDTEREAGVTTGEGWKVLRSEAHAPIPVDGRALGNVYIVVGPGEALDAARYAWGWTAPDYDDAAWPEARPLRQAVPKWGHHFDIYHGWKLVRRTIPPMEEKLERIPEIDRAEGLAAHDGFLRGTEPLVVPPNTRAVLLLDQTHLTTAYPELRVSGGDGATLRLTYAEALVDSNGAKGNRDEIAGKRIRGYHDLFRPDGGADRLFRPLWWRTYRYLQLDVETAEDSLTIHDLYGMFTAYPFQERAVFTSSDPTLQAIWNVGWRTARLCAGETYFDCPYYEQLQYVGDTRIQALISLYVSGDDRLVRRAIQDFNQSRVPDGLTESRAPARDPQFIPPYSLFWVVMVHDYWRHRPDTAFVRSMLTGIRGVLDWYEGYLDETGMLGPMPGWNFVDWSYKGGTYLGGVPPGADDGHSSVIALQYVYALDRAAELAEAFGRGDEAAHYRGLSESVKVAVLQRCWDERRRLFADAPDKKVFSQHANVMAILVDLIPQREQAGLMERVLTDESLVPCTYYYRFYLNQALKKAGLGNRFVQELGPWRQMLALGLTTFAEEPDPTRSDCHAWSASPNYEFLATVLGIEPAAPGFGAVRIAPHLGTLAWAEGRMPHPAGEIRVNLRRRDGGGVRAEIVLPAALTGTFVWQGTAHRLQGGAQTLDL